MMGKQVCDILASIAGGWLWPKRQV
jgi:hypothetical protein